MTLPFALKKILYYILLTLSFLTSLYLIYINIDEVIKRSSGKYTIFSQMSWLTDGQAVLYCSILTIIFIIFLTLLGYRLYHKNKKGAILISILTLVFGIGILFFETLLYNKPI
jgi:hypothetical protein